MVEMCKFYPERCFVDQTKNWTNNQLGDVHTDCFSIYLLLLCPFITKPHFFTTLDQFLSGLPERNWTTGLPLCSTYFPPLVAHPSPYSSLDNPDEIVDLKPFLHLSLHAHSACYTPGTPVCASVFTCTVMSLSGPDHAWKGSYFKCCNDCVPTHTLYSPFYKYAHLHALLWRVCVVYSVGGGQEVIEGALLYSSLRGMLSGGRSGERGLVLT